MPRPFRVAIWYNYQPMTRIERYGWRHPVEPGIGRVVSAHGDYYRLVCNEADGVILARKK